MTDGFYIQHMDANKCLGTIQKSHRMTISHEQDETTENAMICIKIRYSDATILEHKQLFLRIIPQFKCFIFVL